MSIERITTTLWNEPSGRVYSALVDEARHSCKSALLVVRDLDSIDSRATTILKMLEQHQSERTQASEWPGTRLLQGSATVYRYHLTDGCAETLKRATHHLYGWLHPNLPEDLCFIRDDGSPWLVSIAHERDSYLQLSAAEVENLKIKLPELFAANPTRA